MYRGNCGRCNRTMMFGACFLGLCRGNRGHSATVARRVPCAGRWMFPEGKDASAKHGTKRFNKPIFHRNSLDGAGNRFAENSIDIPYPFTLFFPRSQRMGD